MEGCEVSWIQHVGSYFGGHTNIDEHDLNGVSGCIMICGHEKGNERNRGERWGLFL